jgi:ABC-type lipoprotein release transport system permease subunit
MSVALAGALVGLLLGLIAYAAIVRVAEAMPNPDTKKVLRIAGMVDVIVFPVVGWFVAPMIFGGAG